MGAKGAVHTALKGHKLLGLDSLDGGWRYVCECEMPGDEPSGYAPTYRAVRAAHIKHKEQERLRTMRFPKTRDDLIQAGYRFDNHARCRGCKQEIEWWLTPSGRKMPMNLMQEGPSEAVSHFVTCENAPQFR